ncbi:MAG: FeGP cofactor biosynthesis guanylyltransferase HcgB family protein [Desulfurobacteriaceae bacterium]
MLEEYKVFRKAISESLEGKRKGDKPSETALIRESIRKGKLGIVSSNSVKFNLMKNTISTFGINKVKWVKIPTENFDLTDIPALFKALAGRNVEDCDFFLARGRLGVPGSGALTVLIDKLGRILSAVTSPPHHLHCLSLETAVILDTIRVLRRIGFSLSHKGITEKTKTVYSSLSLLDVAREIARKKAEPLQKFRGERLLIVGGYLAGIFLPEFLSKNFSEIFIYDKEEKVLELTKKCGTAYLTPDKNKEYDLVLDLTGYGGANVKEKTVEGFKGKVVVSELASGIQNFEKKGSPDYILKPKVLFANTSGTMTLTVKVARKVADNLEKEKDVLYAVPQLLFAESFLFNLKKR